MISRPVVVSPVKAILRDPRAGRQRLAGLHAEAVDDVEHARRAAGRRSAPSARGSTPGVCSAGLSTTALPAASAGRELPDRHQDREVPRDDLADDAERLVEVVGDGVVVDLGRADPPGRGSRRRSSGSGRRPAGCRRRGSRGPACRCPSSRRRRASRGSASIRSAILLQDVRRARRPRSCPRRARRAWAASSASSTSSAVPRATSQNVWPVTGVGFSKYWPLTGGDVLAADEVVVARLGR